MKDGEYIDYYDNGEIRSKCLYLDGKRHGEHIGYYLSGEISHNCNHIGDILHGEFIFYYRSGEISYVWYYIYSECVSELEWISYNRNLKLEFLGL